MARNVFVYLPVKDLRRSIRFFSQLGFCFDPRFTDDRAACLMVSTTTRAMLITEPRFRRSVPAGVCDARVCNEVLIALTLDNRIAVDQMIANALAAGGSTLGDPRDDGITYQHGFRDPDGHLWEVLHVVEEQAEAVPG